MDDGDRELAAAGVTQLAQQAARLQGSRGSRGHGGQKSMGSTDRQLAAARVTQLTKQAHSTGVSRVTGAIGHRDQRSWGSDVN